MSDTRRSKWAKIACLSTLEPALLCYKELNRPLERDETSCKSVKKCGQLVACGLGFTLFGSLSLPAAIAAYGVGAAADAVDHEGPERQTMDETTPFASRRR